MPKCSYMTDSGICAILSEQVSETFMVEEPCVEGPCPYDDSVEAALLEDGGQDD